jgi:CheY-like chemotaxis protein
MAHLLVIDDDDAVLRSLERILDRAGYQVTTVGDGREALRRLQAEAPDLVITDVFMPEMDGIEFLLQVRELHPELPILVISGGGFAPADFVLEDASQLGADAILPKPFEQDQVLERVARLLADSDG